MFSKSSLSSRGRQRPGGGPEHLDRPERVANLHELSQLSTPRLAQALDPDVSELYSRPRVVILEPNVALERTSSVAREKAHRRGIKDDVHAVTYHVDLEPIPLADAPRRLLRGWREGVDRARTVRRAAGGVGVGVVAPGVDLDFVALVDGEPPVVGGIAAAEGREAQEDSGVIEHARGAPVHPQDEVAELLGGVPEQPNAASG